MPCVFSLHPLRAHSVTQSASTCTHTCTARDNDGRQLSQESTIKVDIPQCKRGDSALARNVTARNADYLPERL